MIRGPHERLQGGPVALRFVWRVAPLTIVLQQVPARAVMLSAIDKLGTDMTIAEELTQLESLQTAVLREVFRVVVGLDSRSNNRSFLIKRIAYVLQARAELRLIASGAPSAGLPVPATTPFAYVRSPAQQAQAERASAAVVAAAVSPAAVDPARGAGEARAATPANSPAARETGARDPRIPPPGTVLERQHDGRKVRVTVLEDGFEYEGRTYSSLSPIAREVTGTIWNGLLFFGLVRRGERKRSVG